ncbi:NAD(P)H-hydrate epimerase, partial [Phenoliferia sp. Uapishka_3]
MSGYLWKSAPKGIKYITASEAQSIDSTLMGPEGAFSLDQLMELAGLAIAQSLSIIYPLGPALPLDKNGIKQKRTNERVLVCCGPGNQGGDGLVAARHLYHFGYAPSIFYPKRLKRQCENLELPLIAPPPLVSSSFPMSPDAQKFAFQRAISQADVVLDCVFGFSFKPPVRESFKFVLDAFKTTEKPILSVDIPSGWDVETGQPEEGSFVPSALISLTAPKQGVKKYAEEGRVHWLGGRFIGHEMNEKYELNLPEYPGSMQVVDITLPSKKL